MGFSPVDLTHLTEQSFFSSQLNTWNYNYDNGCGGWMKAPNTSNGYHGILIQWWEHFGLGENCLLLSETTKVRELFQSKYPDTSFICTDYYTELIKDASTDIIWNLYDNAPNSLPTAFFNSIICQATFEHLLDPVGVLKKLVSIANNGANIYLHTHLPLYPHHSWPSDYLRFYPEWFKDVCMLIPEITLYESFAYQGHIFALYRVNRQ